MQTGGFRQPLRRSLLSNAFSGSYIATPETAALQIPTRNTGLASQAITPAGSQHRIKN